MAISWRCLRSYCVHLGILLFFNAEKAQYTQWKRREIRGNRRQDLRRIATERIGSAVATPCGRKTAITSPISRKCKIFLVISRHSESFYNTGQTQWQCRGHLPKSSVRYVSEAYYGLCVALTRNYTVYTKLTSTCTM